MKVNYVAAETVFPNLKTQGPLAKILIPTGEYGSSEEDQRLKSLVPGVDPAYRFPGKAFKPYLLAVAHHHNVLFFGSTGVGKTMMAMQFAAYAKLPLSRVNGDGHMGRPEIIGFMGLQDPNDPTDDGYKKSTVVRAIQRPGVLLLDEWDRFQAEASICLQSLLEDNSPGLLLIERDEYVRKHPDCLIVATANTRGLGDSTGLHASAQAQDFAQLNRFHMVLEVEPLNVENMEVVLKGQRYDGKPLKAEVINLLVKLYEATYSAWQANKLTSPISVRSMVHLAEYYGYLGANSLKPIILDKLPTDKDKAVVFQIAQRLQMAPKDS